MTTRWTTFGFAREPAAASLRAGFTLVELVVSIGILGILLVTAGSVFTLTLRSSGQAMAIIETSEAIRIAEQNLREDLRFVPRGASLLVIQGNRVNAHWTIDEREVSVDGNPATDPLAVRDPEREYIDEFGRLRREAPRGDMLMFFTGRPGRSFRDPRVQSRLQWVVYGHAELGTLNPATEAWQVPPLEFARNAIYDTTSGEAPNAAMPLPASEWLLARRSTLIVDQPAASLPSETPPAPSLDDSLDVLGSSDDDDAFSSLAAARWLCDGRRDYVVNAFAPASPVNDFNFAQYVLALQVDFSELGSPVAAVPPSGYPGSHSLDWITPWFARSRMDPSPPVILRGLPASVRAARQARRMGHLLLPRCASFKVEWALPPPGDASLRRWYQRLLELQGGPFWVDPGDMRGTRGRLVQLLDVLRADVPPEEIPVFERFNGTLLAEFPARNDPVRYYRFSPSVVGSNHAFYPFDPATDPSSGVPDPMFPPALQITIDVYDGANRLQRPIRHVMVIPVGGEE